MREAIYKGATRPAMKWGVPLLALVLVFMPAVVIGAWGGTLVSPWIAILVTVVIVPLYFWMRWVTRRDDQRLMQMLMRLRLAQLNPNSALWGGRSYGSHRQGSRHA